MPVTNPGIQYPIFEFNGKILYLREPPYSLSNDSQSSLGRRGNYTNKVNMLENYELCGIEDGVYTWIICYDERSAAGDVPLLYLTRVQNIHEIGTKHMHIVNAKCSNGNVQYAGELIKIGNTLRVNLLSGTYMLDKVNSSNVPVEIQNEIRNIFQNIIRSECPNDIQEIVIENTTETYIKDMKMTIGDLIELTNYGYQVYEFPDEKEAKKYKGAIHKLAGLKWKLDSQLLQKYKNENLIQQTKDEIKKYEQLLEKEPLTREQLKDIQMKQFVEGIKMKQMKQMANSTGSSRKRNAGRNRNPNNTAKRPKTKIGGGGRRRRGNKNTFKKRK